MHLQVLGYKKLGNKEIDFVYEKQGEKNYIQVACLINEQNKERESGDLLSIKDNYPKSVISMDEFISNNK